MTKDEALKMAIEAMETADAIVWEFGGVAYEKLQEALKICKEALEQPAQEPVAWLFIDDGNKYISFNKCLDEGKHIPLYAKENVDD